MRAEQKQRVYGFYALWCALPIAMGLTAFLTWARTKSAGSLVLTLLHMSNCYGNINPIPLQGSGTGLNDLSVTCPQLMAAPSNTSWPSIGTVYGCDLGFAEGPWTAADLIAKFCQPFAANCASVWEDAFTAGSKSQPGSRHVSLTGQLMASVGMYCEANTSGAVAVAIVITIAALALLAMTTLLVAAYATKTYNKGQFRLCDGNNYGGTNATTRLQAPINTPSDDHNQAAPTLPV